MDAPDALHVVFEVLVTAAIGGFGLWVRRVDRSLERIERAINSANLTDMRHKVNHLERVQENHDVRIIELWSARPRKL